ncbi:dipeptidyl carboxypeptidase II [Pseudoduganella sp. FT25W]|uniref:Dipeptidyl carboxypeptidase n=1 Tax=Duganella alba TaxID=2666081 RepID=A0A6L5QJ29_9BURK|nr:M3 family metallopeptidase [Duganella alba]MRX09292.1 dipeptidyl carboxypeptidase II [Duganella alba]MRX17186.1 dipeptidyl carboxypeptidase II [Duganella alba]
MNRTNMIIAAGVAAVFGAAHAEPASMLPASNPFAKPSTLSFGYPAFDKIKNEDYAPAFEEGMRQNAAEIEAIANNKKPATFDNTIVAMEKSGQLLSRVSSVFGNLSGANTNDTFKALERELSPKLAAHSDAIRLNGKLYARIKSLYEQRDKLHLDAESKYLLERYHTDFVRAGAQLSDADKQKLKAMNAELAKLQTTFAQNVLEEANASALVVDSREELAGMPDKAIDAAAAAAKAKGQDGKFLIPVVNTTGQANLAVLTNRAVREKLMALSLARGSHGGQFDNTQVVLSLAKLRAEKAALLGYPSYAAYALEDQTAHDPEAVNKMLSEFARPAVANAKKEGAEIQQVIDKEKGGFELAAQDWSFYSDKVRAERFNFDQNQLKPYFELNNVITNGVFYAANKVYGLTFKERKDLPVYDPDVRVWDVFDTNGKQLAIFIGDYYARSNKRGGAWMNAYVSQSSLMGTHPVVANHLNIPKPNPGEPTLLTYDELRTAFHEFGHALHGMFSNVKYPRFSGTRVPRDFVEFPSQVNEMWSVYPAVLANYAKHYQTGAPMPQELLDKVIASKKFNEGFRTTEYLAASILDQKWHQLGVSQMPGDVLTFEASALKSAGVDYAPVPPRYRTTYFSHVFSGGYSAGYYGYLWSEKLDADTVDWFNENGGMLRKNGDYFRKMLLSKGGTMDAMQMYRNFRGRDAKIEPLLERRGLTEK